MLIGWDILFSKEQGHSNLKRISCDNYEIMIGYDLSFPRKGESKKNQLFITVL